MPLAYASDLTVRQRPFCFAGGPASRPRRLSERYTSEEAKLGMLDFTKYFSTLISDIEVAQDSIFVVQETNRYAWMNRKRLDDAYSSDQFLIRNIRAHKVTAIISLHKVYDDGRGTKSIDHLIQWMHKNIAQFTKEGIIRRRVSGGMSETGAKDYAKGLRKLTVAKIRRLAEFKRNLQGMYDRDVRNIRNWAFAHRPVGVDASELKVDHKTLSILANGAKGIYENAWQAFHNGRNLPVKAISYRDPWDLKESIAAYFQKYIRE